VSLVEENLGRDVLGGAAQRVGLEGHPLREAEVGDLEVAGLVQEEVLGLEVAVDEVLGVQELEDEDDVGGVELRKEE
jgi:hypothetical protein